MARSRTGRKKATRVQPIVAGGRLARASKPIPAETQARIREAHAGCRQRIQVATQPIRAEWEAFLAGVRIAVGAPDGWVLDTQGEQLVFAEPLGAPPAAAPAAPEPEAAKA